MKIVTKAAVQAHAVPERVYEPEGPFPPSMRGYSQKRADLNIDGADFETLEEHNEYSHQQAQSEIVYDYAPAMPEDGSGFLPGATAQNNYKPPVYLRCALCFMRVLETETEDHICEE